MIWIDIQQEKFNKITDREKKKDKKKADKENKYEINKWKKGLKSSKRKKYYQFKNDSTIRIKKKRKANIDKILAQRFSIAI